MGKAKWVKLPVGDKTVDDLAAYFHVEHPGAYIKSRGEAWSLHFNGDFYCLNNSKWEYARESVSLPGILEMLQAYHQDISRWYLCWLTFEQEEAAS